MTDHASPIPRERWKRSTGTPVAGKNSSSAIELVPIWVIHRLQMIGEAANGISPGTGEWYPAVPWGEIIGLRNILVHHYFTVEPTEIWAVIERDLPPLRESVRRILGEMAENP